MPFEIIYDRNFREDKERRKKWSLGDEVPDIAPHRIIELHADGTELKHLETTLGPVARKQMSFYGDHARTVFVNLGREWDDADPDLHSTKK
jgi:hypothetical protein